ncbi:MAG: DciA family protein [Minwuia sp.]|nr:DciA family protein [Minwuia sp.]
MAGEKSDSSKGLGSVPRRGKGGFRRAGEDVAAILSPAFKRRGFAQTDIVLRWPEIVGAALADQCRPERLAWPRVIDGQEKSAAADGAILHLSVSPGWATEIQHLEPLLIERVNRFFGWRAVTGMRLRQVHLKPTPETRQRKHRPLSESESAELDRVTAMVTDADARRVLRGLGESIFTADDKTAK